MCIETHPPPLNPDKGITIVTKKHSKSGCEVTKSTAARKQID